MSDPIVAQIKSFVQGRVQQTTDAAGLSATETGKKAQAALKQAQKTTSAAASTSVESLQTLIDQINRSRVVSDVKLLGQAPNLVVSGLTGGGLDDRKLLLERLVTLLASLPVTSKVSQTLSDALISIIWADLPHPAVSFVGPQHRFRRPDGSDNNIQDPKLGASNQPYSRNVPRLHPQMVNLPDPGTVYDLLFARDSFEPHPSGISSLLFNFANIIIHDIFSTTRQLGAHSSYNEHSSYLDLQVVYGATLEEQERVRSGTLGLLKPDAIGDWRLAMMPPSTAALGVLFSRSHNFIAKRLYEVNENKRFDDLEGEPLDEELFGIARLVNCGLFLHIVLRDYIPVILNTNDSEWYVNPVEVIKNITGPGSLERGIGNSVAAEFSVLYRWHAAVSQMDEKWMNSFLESQFPGKRPEDVTPMEFVETASALKHGFMDTDPGQWNLHDWDRDTQGKFDDAVLAQVLRDATSDVAAAFRARGHPSWFRPIEILGMITARKDWALCTMNEFRHYLGLKTYSSFSEWNPDPNVYKAAEMLYGHIDNLELYPGLMAEETKPSVPGSGLCPGYTISRGILSDAAALTRGDRFYTQDFSAANLTSSGFDYCNTPQPGSHGMIGKLIMSTLPGQFPYNSIYALYPFHVPEKTIAMLKEKRIFEHYDTSCPKSARRWHTIESYSASKIILEDSRFFVALPPMSYDENLMITALHSIPRWQDEVSEFYSVNTDTLMKERSIPFSPSSRQRIVDLLDVVNTVSAQFTSKLFGLPTPGSHGLHLGMTPTDLFATLAKPLAYAMYGSFDFQGHQTWQLEEQSEACTRRLKNLIWARIHTVDGFLSPIFSLVQGISNAIGGPGNIAANEMARQFYHTLFASGKNNDELVKDCLHMMVSLTATHSLVLMQVFKWFLEEENLEHFSAMCMLAQKNDPASIVEMRDRIMEAYRHSSITPPQAKFALQAVVLADANKGKVHVSTGEGIYISPTALYRDPMQSHDPERFAPNRKIPVRLGLGDAPSQAILEVALPVIAKQFFKHASLSMAPAGPPPVVNDAGPTANEKLPYFVSNEGSEHPIPINTSMHVVYEAR
ncbi:putative dioxygenase Ssp1 [Melanopsichium pennsylvanicum]|uniref:Dioxygenase Ssp1 n=2 Tax=Melanopsichium pennsylvanicum TaxID=63383 RepID=A0AAJ4XRJ6_9BASI|nr:putative dioxygenase Ssp1 [Melanopsichium pennsylvanicum 4]SNX87067.1 putative dioxygenase Ssp1 [Melanopsichium pennsylvanicum]